MKITFEENLLQNELILKFHTMAEKMYLNTTLFLFGVLFLQASAYNCPQQECDMTPTISNALKLFVDQAFNTYPNNYCAAAEFIKSNLDAYFNQYNWVVMIGGNQLLTSRIEFGVSVKRVIQTSYRYQYMDKHDVEVFATDFNKEKPKPIIRKGNKMSSKAIGSCWTDMDPLMSLGFQSATNEAFKSEKEDADFRVIADQITRRITCSGNWITIVAGRDRLERDSFCIAYNRIPGTYFKAEWKRSDSTPVSHQVLSFAPGRLAAG